MPTPPPIYVVARPGALAQARNGTPVAAIARQITETHGRPSRATVYNVFNRAGYPIRKDKAEVIAATLGRPVGALFVHRDGAPLA